jgi:hypothetical protein
MLFDKQLFDKLFDIDLGDLDGETLVPESPDDVQPELVVPPAISSRDNLLDIEICNESRSIHISSHANELNVLVGHDGLASTPGELAHFDHAILDGGSVSGSRAQSRRIRLDFVAKGICHRSVASLFPLGRKETLKFTRGGVTRTIQGYRDGTVELHAASALATPVVSVTFLCPNPLFQSEEDIQVKLDGVLGGLEYPIEPYGYPLNYGTAGGSGSTRVVNRGDHPAPFVLSMTATATGNLGLRVNGEEQMRIIDVVSSEHIVLDTAQKILSIGGQKRLSALEGNFPRLPVGESHLELVGLAGNPQLSFSELYEGV